MADNDQNKHLPASRRKLDKARSEGQVARSRDFGHFAAIAAGGALVVALAPWIASSLQRMLARALAFDATTLKEPGAMTARLGDMSGSMALVALPFGAVTLLAAVGGACLVSGWTWSLKPMVPKFDGLNPLTGVGRIFAKAQLLTALKACALALLLCLLGAFYLKGHVEDYASTLQVSLPAGLALAGKTTLHGMVLVLLVLAAFALIDVPLQHYLHAQKLRMSHQEVKQEHKELEGNAEVKSKVRARMKEMTRRRMMAAVPTADLVVMNPTHYAVALKYDDARMTAPRVVAKGADLLALRIRDSAKGAKVPVLEAPTLARALYAHAELDREIPAALFAAVAQVLAYVYQLRAALNGHGAMPQELPALDVPAELDPHHRPAS